MRSAARTRLVARTPAQGFDHEPHARLRLRPRVRGCNHDVTTV